MPRQKRPEPEPLESACDPISMSELEDVVHEILNQPLPDNQYRQNRNPTLIEVEQKFKLERRR